MKETLLKYRLFIFTLSVLLVSFATYYALEFFENEVTVLPYYGESTANDEGERIYQSIPGFAFTDQSGLPVTDKSMDGKVTVVNYFFTSCPTICPKMTYNLQTVHDLYRNDSEVLILSFTVDPKRDTPERLLQYADRYNVDHYRWHFLTGDKLELYRLARRGFFLSATESPGNDLDFIHSENLVLLDQKKKIRGYYNGIDKGSVDQLIKDIVKLKKERT